MDLQSVFNYYKAVSYMLISQNQNRKLHRFYYKHARDFIHKLASSYSSSYKFLFKKQYITVF